MNRCKRNMLGVTLIEMTLVLATIVLLIGVGVPAVRALVNSFHSQGATQSMISAALSSARAMAVKNRKYTGVRFQKLCTSHDSMNPLKGVVDAPQYMIFIVRGDRSEMEGLTKGFKAIDGLEPVRLPETIGVIDLSQIVSDASIDSDVELNDATAFSIIFSPSGKLVAQDVRTRNREGHYQPNNDSTDKESTDEIFNSDVNIIKYKLGMFLQDDYPDYGLDEEASRTSFVFYNPQRLRTEFKTSPSTMWSNYLSTLAGDAVYVSPYTGILVSTN